MVEPNTPKHDHTQMPKSEHWGYTHGANTLKQVMGSSVGDAVSKDQGMQSQAIQKSVMHEDE